MVRKQDIFALVGKRMCASPRHGNLTPDYDRPQIADLIRRIDRALLGVAQPNRQIVRQTQSQQHRLRRRGSHVHP
jgi:hypothetical protein